VGPTGINALVATARKLVAGGKGLLAMDESNPSCNTRFAAAGIPQSEEGRRAYRPYDVCCASSRLPFLALRSCRAVNPANWPLPA
jgi:hypothetical protein